MVNWGILGCGRIAHKFAECFTNNSIDGAKLLAAAARDIERANNFSQKHSISKTYGSYEDLVQDPEVDAIYIATPHSHHKDQALLCLDNGKSVLCEKAFTINSEEASIVVSRAKEKKLFVMEAMWMRFLPAMIQLRQIIEKKTLGSVKSVEADFSFKGSDDPKGRLLNPSLAGGALLDVGIYPLSFSMMVFGETPVKISGSAEIGSTNVDESNKFELEYSDNRFAKLSSSVVKEGSKRATVHFEKGKIELPMFWRGQSLEISTQGNKEIKDFPFDVNGFEYEIREAVKCISKSQLESEIMPLSETLNTIEIMDKLRSEWGLSYPMETKEF